MKVLISGGAGFIGTCVAASLLNKGHEVTILDNFSPQIHGDHTELPAHLKDHVRLVRGDVRNEDAWTESLPGQDALINLAAETGTGQSMYEVMKYEQVNLAGTAIPYEMLSAGKYKTISRIVVASSRAIYGEGAYKCAQDGTVYPKPRSSEDKKAGHFDPLCPVCGGAVETTPTPEAAPFQPSSFYGLTKQVQEQMTLMFGGVLGIDSYALRYQNVYGPGQSLKNPYTGILAIFSNLARLGADIKVFEDGVESRDFVYIDDVVDATVASLLDAPSGSYALNVGSDARTSVMEVANAVNEYFGSKSSVSVNGAFREGDIRHGLADLSTARKVLGYSPKWNFRDGLNNFLAWAQESEPEKAGYERSLEEMRQRGLLHGN